MKFPLESAVFSALKIGVNQLLPILVLPFLMGRLGDYPFGVLMIVQTLSVFGVVFVEFGFGLSGVRLVTEARGGSPLLQAYRDVNLVKLMACGVGAVALWLGVQIVEMDAATRLALVAGYLSVLGAAVQPLWFFSGLERFKLISLTQIIARGLCLGAVFLVVRSPADFLLAVALYFLPNVLSGLWLRAYASGALHALGARDVPYRLDLGRATGVLRTASDYFLAQSSAIVFAGLNTLVVGYFCGAVDSGRYALAEKLMRGLAILSAPVTEAIYPRVVAGFQSDVPGVLVTLRRWFWLGLLVYGVVCGLLVVAWWVASTVHVEQKWLDIGFLLLLLSPVPGLIYANNLCGTQVLLGLGHAILFRNVLMRSCIVLVGCSLLFSLWWGVVGAAVALLTGEFLICLGMWRASCEVIGYNWVRTVRH
jgi:PST family polysaccharide transporter